jgi:class 3 adenylate cyclase
MMLSDIADAGTAAEQLGPERWEKLLRDHHTLVEQLLAHHEGQVVRRESDGFFASFNSAHAGLHAAVELQRTFTGSAAGGEHTLALRVGLHSGFVISNPEQLLGRNVVLAARIAAQAKPGEILVSSNVKEYTSGDPRFQFEERGEHHFKGLHGEHVVYAVAWR